MKLLILDDDGFYRTYFKSALEIYDNEVDAIGNADDFIVLIENGEVKNYDIIILDRMLRKPADHEIQKSEEVGDYLFKMLRKKYPKIRIIILTAKMMPPAQEDALDTYTKLMIKPITDIKEFLKIAKKLQ